MGLGSTEGTVITPGSVGPGDFAPGAIYNADVNATAAVSLDKLQAMALGEMIKGDGVNGPGVVVKGLANQVWTMNAGATDCGWAPAAVGGAWTSAAGATTLNTSTDHVGIGAAPSTTKLLVTENVGTSGTPNVLTVTGAAHTGLTASTEVIGVDFDLSATQQWATGALALQRGAVFRAPTYAFAGASVVTDATTVAITGAPIAGANATIDDTYALWVQSGLSKFSGLNNPGVGADSETFGELSVAAGQFGVAYGYNSSAGGFASTSVGASTAAGGVQASCFGATAAAAGDNSAAFGFGAISSGSDSTAFGKGATATQTQATCFGSGALASGTGGAMAVGRSAAASGASSLAFGTSSIASASGANAIGNTTNVTHASSIGLGSGATSTAGNQFVVGSPGDPITTIWLGEGVSSSTPQALSIHGTNAVGSDLGTYDLTISASIPTGDNSGNGGAVGRIVLRTADGVDTGGATPQSTVNALYADKGVVGIGAAPLTNMVAGDILLEGGSLVLKEIATPTADANYGKVYTKNDDKLYFQDGAGVEHEIAFV